MPAEHMRSVFDADAQCSQQDCPHAQAGKMSAPAAALAQQPDRQALADSSAGRQHSAAHSTAQQPMVQLAAPAAPKFSSSSDRPAAKGASEAHGRISSPGRHVSAVQSEQDEVDCSHVPCQAPESAAAQPGAASLCSRIELMQQAHQKVMLQQAPAQPQQLTSKQACNSSPNVESTGVPLRMLCLQDTETTSIEQHEARCCSESPRPKQPLKRLTRAGQANAGDGAAKRTRTAVPQLSDASDRSAGSEAAEDDSGHSESSSSDSATSYAGDSAEEEDDVMEDSPQLQAKQAGTSQGQQAVRRRGTARKNAGLSDSAAADADPAKLTVAQLKVR